MKSINDISNMVVSNAQAGYSAQERKSLFTKEERQPIAFFFMRLSEIYGIEYNRQIPDTDAEIRSKREWGDELKHYNRPQLEKGLKFIKDQMAAGYDRWEFLNLGRCIGAIREANRSTAAHKALPAPTERKVGKDEALSLFALMRENVGLEPVETKPEITLDIESEPADMNIIERNG